MHIQQYRFWLLLKIPPYLCINILKQTECPFKLKLKRAQLHIFISKADTRSYLDLFILFYFIFANDDHHYLHSQLLDPLVVLSSTAPLYACWPTCTVQLCASAATPTHCHLSHFLTFSCLICSLLCLQHTITSLTFTKLVHCVWSWARTRVLHIPQDPLAYTPLIFFFFSKLKCADDLKAWKWLAIVIHHR